MKGDAQAGATPAKPTCWWATATATAGGTIVGAQVELGLDAGQVVAGLAHPSVEPTNAEIVGAATASSVGEIVSPGGAGIIIPSWSRFREYRSGTRSQARDTDVTGSRFLVVLMAVCRLLARCLQN
jgi:hypothetical protein